MSVPEVIRLPQRRPALKPRSSPILGGAVAAPAPLPRIVRDNDDSKASVTYRLEQQARAEAREREEEIEAMRRSYRRRKLIRRWAKRLAWIAAIVGGAVGIATVGQL